MKADVQNMQMQRPEARLYRWKCIDLDKQDTCKI